jgi:hypothetical protein
MDFINFFREIGLKIILTVIAAALVTIGIMSFFYYNQPQPSAPKFENTSYYDSQTHSIVLANNTASLSGLTNCDIYVSGPSKQIKYFETVSCNSLSTTEISKQDLLSLFNNQNGIYTIILYSENTTVGKILQVSISG